jgi:hypothetical protein
VALELVNATQICSWAPPLPQRAFQILAAGSTTEDMGMAGGASDGVRYGYLVLNTTQWQNVEGMHTPPIQPGERFLIYAAPGTFNNPPAFESGKAAVPNNFPSKYALDLYNVYGMTEDRENSGGVTQYINPIPILCTVQSVQQASNNSWWVYYSPWVGSDFTITPQKNGLVTIPQPYNPVWLGTLGHVAGVNYSYALPGGPDQLSCILRIEPTDRSLAMNPGRILTAHRGSACIWEGTLTEPQPAATGWTLTANGVATYGSNFGAWWQANAGPSKTSSGWTSDAPIDFAIGRGLRWRNNGIGSPAGIYLGPVQNPGSLTITDFLNLLCTGGQLTWELVQPAGSASMPPAPWEIKVFPMPTDVSGNPIIQGAKAKITQAVLNNGTNKWVRTDTLVSNARRPPDLYLVNTNPIARTIANDYNTIIVYYEATADTTATSTKTAAAATFATTFASIPGSRTAHGPLEYFLDVSNAGAMSQAAAATIAQNVLNKYIRANFANSFAVMPGQLLNVGGSPVDLGCNWGGSMCTVQVINEAYGGEVGMAPITFLIGEYEYDDDTQTATITPYQNALTDMSSVIAQLYPGKFA